MFLREQQQLDHLNELSFLNLSLQNQNQRLREQLVRVKEEKYLMELRLINKEEIIQNLKKDILCQKEKQSQEMKKHIKNLHDANREYLEKKFEQLETSSIKKLKKLNIVNTNNRLENHQLKQFKDKIVKEYEKNQKKLENDKQILIWIRNLVSQDKNKENFHESKNLIKQKSKNKL